MTAPSVAYGQPSGVGRSLSTPVSRAHQLLLQGLPFAKSSDLEEVREHGSSFVLNLC